MNTQMDSQRQSSESSGSGQQSGGFSAEERAAMKQRSKELKAEAERSARSKKAKSDGESDVMAKIEEMPEHDRQMALRIHEIVKTNAPDLTPKTWYGMPAYARDKKVVCFFQAASKFDARYATFGFDETANLDEGDMWATSFAVKELTPEVEDRIAALVRKAIS